MIKKADGMKPILVAVLGLSSLFSLNTLANVPDFAHISTTGYGEVSATPDIATFSVKVVESTMTAEQAKKNVDKVVKSFLQQLKSSGVKSEEINSSNLYLVPQYHYPKSGKPELVGYKASRKVTVQVNDLANLNQYLDVALSNGINQVDNIQLKVRDKEKYQQQARLAAIKDANNKAASLADGFDVELEDIWRIDYHAQPSQPVMMRSMAMDAKTESNGYQDASIVIRDRVEVVYSITP